MRKDIIFINILKAVLMCGIVLGLLYFVSYNEHHYTRTGFCKTHNNGVYYFYDSKGNVWEFYSDEYISPEDTIEVKMFSNYTIDNIKDDVIIDYQILGRSELKIEIEKDLDS